MARPRPRRLARSQWARRVETSDRRSVAFSAEWQECFARDA
nr:MAG TPA: hypothetical protein [Caudoviricetes sp.]